MMHTYKQIDFSDYDSVFDDLLLDYPRTNLLADKSIPIVTMGSCFAGNLATAIANYGYDAKVVPFSENVNTPLFNRLFMEFLIHGPDSENAETICKIMYSSDDPGPIKETHAAILKRFKESRLFVLTLGVGFLWMNDKGNILGSIHAKDIASYKSSFLSVASQATIIQDILRYARLVNPTISIVITISPVPLNVCNSPRSQIMADCLSKSTLRLAVQQVITTDKNVHYFPSFEFFRWASGHSNRAFFGSDGIVRHPDVDLVNLVVSKFIEINGGALTQNLINQHEETV